MKDTNRRDFIKTALAANVAAGAAAGVSAAAAGSASAKTPFKLCILFGDNPERPPTEIAPGFDLAEVPVSLQLIPLETNQAWEAKRKEISSWKLPPIKMSSHFIPAGPVTGPNVDTDWLDFWMKRAFPRIAEMGVEVAGVYGNFFAVPDGFPRAKARDQALKFASQLADYARRYKVLIALEPTGVPATVFPKYVDGVAFARELGRPEVRVMADTAYFLAYDQPLEDIAKAPEYCLHCHIAGEKGQPGVGDRVEYHTRLFRILRDIGYTRGVSCACPWVDTSGSGKLHFGVETAKTLRYLRDLRDKVYSS
jgi:sugar phosphate isomerase/epimerase